MDAVSSRYAIRLLASGDGEPQLMLALRRENIEAEDDQAHEEQEEDDGDEEEEDEAMDGIPSSDDEEDDEPEAEPDTAEDMQDVDAGAKREPEAVTAEMPQGQAVPVNVAG